MSGHVDDVIDATRDPVIAIGIAAAAVAGEIFAFVGREIGLLETGVIAIHSTHLPRPGPGDAEIALALAPEHLAFGVDDFRHDAEKRLRRRAGLEPGGAWQRRDQNAAGLGLPPGIDNRAALVANHPVIPFPGLRI